MFQQFQQLESDVAELRGIVEEQSHLIEKLQSEQKEQYLDLDRRLTLLLKGQAGAVRDRAAIDRRRRLHGATTGHDDRAGDHTDNWRRTPSAARTKPRSF